LDFGGNIPLADIMAEQALWRKYSPNIKPIYLSVRMMACVVYQDVLSGRWHSTPYLLDILSVRGGQACCAVPLDNEVLKSTQVVALLDPFGTVPPN
jgi:hypothetical protein